MAGEMVPERLAELMSRKITRPVSDRQIIPFHEQQLVSEFHERSWGLPKPILSLRRVFLSSLLHFAEDTSRGKEEVDSSTRMKKMRRKFRSDMLSKV